MFGNEAQRVLVGRPGESIVAHVVVDLIRYDVGPDGAADTRSDTTLQNMSVWSRSELVSMTQTHRQVEDNQIASGDGSEVLVRRGRLNDGLVNDQHGSIWLGGELDAPVEGTRYNRFRLPSGSGR